MMILSKIFYGEVVLLTRTSLFWLKLTTASTSATRTNPLSMRGIEQRRGLADPLPRE